jgi:hypothetical protein
MRHFRIVIITFFLVIINDTSSFAQQKVNVTNIDIVAVDKDMHVILFEKIGQDDYKYKELFIENDFDSFLEIVFDDEDDYVYSLEEIQEEYEQLIFVNDIMPITFDYWNAYDWKLQNAAQSVRENFVIKFPSSHLAAYQDVEASTEYGDPEWNLVDEYWFQTILVNFGNEKEILLLAEEEAIIYACIPLQHSVKLFSDEEEDLTQMIPIEKGTYFVEFYEAFEDFDPEYTYAIEKDPKTNKYKLLDYYKKDMLQASFDTIFHNEYFIVGKEKNAYTFYTSYLKKIDIPEAKKVYLRKNRIEILTSSGPKYYGYLGNTRMVFVQQLQVGNPNYQYELIRDEHRQQQHSIQISERNRNHSREETREFIFTNIKNKNSITFLDNTTTKDWEENKGSQSKYPQYLKVGSKGSYGLFSYTYTMNTEDSEKEIITNDTLTKIIHKKPANIKVKKELPIKYDDIKIYNSMILFYNNNKVGIFQKHHKPMYELLEKDTGNFYKIVKNGKSSWLDINTMEEFF